MTREEQADRFIDSVLHLFELGPRVDRRPLEKPKVVFLPNPGEGHAALYQYSRNTIEVFNESSLEWTLVHELVHAWWWQEKQLHYHAAESWHGPRFQEKLAAVYFRLGWGKPDELTRSCKTEPGHMTTGYPLIMDLWPK